MDRQVMVLETAGVLLSSGDEEHGCETRDVEQKIMSGMRPIVSLDQVGRA